MRIREIIDIIEGAKIINTMQDDAPGAMEDGQLEEADGPLTPEQARKRSERERALSNRRNEENQRHQAKMKTLADRQRDL